MSTLLGSAFTNASRITVAKDNAIGGLVHKCGFGFPAAFGNEKSYSHSDGARVAVPNSHRTALVALASAISRVGSSKLKPFMNTMSDVSRVCAALGGGSKVCEFVPSGTMPVTLVSVPAAMIPTRFVIGATVEATRTARPLTSVPPLQAAYAACRPSSLANGSAMFSSSIPSGAGGCVTTTLSDDSLPEQAGRRRARTRTGAIRRSFILSGYLPHMPCD